MKFILTSFVALLLISAAPTNFDNSANWIESINNGEVSISYDVIKCHGKDLLIYKIENFTTDDLSVSFSADIAESDGSKKLDDISYMRVVPAKSTYEGACPNVNSMSPTDGCIYLPYEYSDPLVTLKLN